MNYLEAANTALVEAIQAVPAAVEDLVSGIASTTKASVASLLSNAATNKELKEASVTGHEGTSPQEILLICASTAAGLWLYQYIGSGSSSSASNSVPSQALLHLLLFVVPTILCQSNMLYPWGIAHLMTELVAAFLLRLCSNWKKNASTRRAAANNARADSSRRLKRASLTVYRSSVMLLTFCAILAVDFASIFPRRFVKTETVGYGFMDLGAASFVVAAGFVSPKARLRNRQLYQSNWEVCQIAMRRVWPLLALGVGRSFAHKGLDYQEHVTEYGAHWNFFFTMALICPLAALLPGPRWSIPVMIMSWYQYALSQKGLQDWIETSPRSCGPEWNAGEGANPLPKYFCDFFAANREGILGSLGYLSLYLMAEWLASVFRWNTEIIYEGVSVTPRPPNFWGLHSEAQQLFRMALIFGLIWRIMMMDQFTSVTQVSRRSVNMPFCVWVLMVNLFQLASMECILGNFNETEGSKVPGGLAAINRHGLPLFVVANLLTGLVNLSVNTLEVEDSTAVLILLGYMSSLSLLALIMDKVFVKGGK